MAAMAATQVELAEAQLVSEGFGIDRTKVEHSASVNKMTDGLKALASVATSGKSLLKGARDALGVAAAGTAFLKEHAFTLHLVLEGRNDKELATSLAMARKIGRAHGVEIENSIPKVMRAKPFAPVRGMLGRDGERWVPIHGVFPLGEAQRVVEAHNAYFADRADFMTQHGIILSCMTMTVGAEFFIEPAFYWLDEITPLHRKSVGEDVVAPWLSRPANVMTREAVIDLRNGTQDVYAKLGGINWQIARDYPYAQRIRPDTWTYMQGIKAAVDPHGLMNPGALGL
jgi:D-lactate dehydrogenase (cytochrome)